MAKHAKNRSTKGSHSHASATSASTPAPFEEARDELFQHIIRCGVVGSAPEHQDEWFADTMTYMTDRYPELGPEQISELRKLGERFSQPPKKKQDDTAAA